MVTRGSAPGQSTTRDRSYGNSGSGWRRLSLHLFPSRVRLFAGGLRGAGRFYRADQNMRVTAFQSRLAFHRAVLGAIRRKPHEQCLAEIGVRDFTTAELHHRLPAVALLEEADGVVLF